MGKQENDVAARKSLVLELIKEECPQSHNLINFDCPVRKVRKLTVENLSDYIDSLSEGQVDNILAYHEDCYRFVF